jgi:hypothetical protein
MNANSANISLETAILLKDCEIENEKYFLKDGEFWLVLEEEHSPMFIDSEGECVDEVEIYPAFTWQEILWEFQEEFFKDTGWATHHTLCILRLLQEKKYEEADLYFRKNCTFLNQLD